MSALPGVSGLWGALQSTLKQTNTHIVLLIESTDRNRSYDSQLIQRRPYVTPHHRCFIWQLGPSLEDEARIYGIATIGYSVKGWSVSILYILWEEIWLQSYAQVIVIYESKDTEYWYFQDKCLSVWGFRISLGSTQNTAGKGKKTGLRWRWPPLSGHTPQ